MKKEKSKALSPEVTGLFERIEKQADEYEKAFVELNKFHRDSERVRRESEELIIKHSELIERNIELCERLEKIENYVNLRLQNVQEEVMKYLEVAVVARINTKANQILNDFEQRAERAIGLIESSDGILQLSKNLKELSKDFEQKLFTVDEKTLTIDNKINSKVEELNQKSEVLNKSFESFNSLKNNIEKNVQESEKKIIDATVDLQQKLEKMFNEMFNNVSFNLENRIKSSIIEVKNSQTVINQKMRNSDTKLEAFIDIAKNLELHLGEIKDSTQTVDKQEFDKLKMQVEEINSALIKGSTQTVRIDATITDSEKQNRDSKKKNRGFEITNN